MNIDEEMRHLASGLRKEINSIDVELEKHFLKISDLMTERRKKAHDLNSLNDGIEYEHIRQEEEKNLKQLIGRRIKI